LTFGFVALVDNAIVSGFEITDGSEASSSATLILPPSNPPVQVKLAASQVLLADDILIPFQKPLLQLL